MQINGFSCLTQIGFNQKRHKCLIVVKSKSYLKATLYNIVFLDSTVVKLKSTKTQLK